MAAGRVDGAALRSASRLVPISLPHIQTCFTGGTKGRHAGGRSRDARWSRSVGVRAAVARPVEERHSRPPVLMPTLRSIVRAGCTWCGRRRARRRGRAGGCKAQPREFMTTDEPKAKLLAEPLRAKKGKFFFFSFFQAPTLIFSHRVRKEAESTTKLTATP